MAVRWWVLAPALLLGSCGAQSSISTLSGTVVDATSGVAIANAVVIVQTAADSVADSYVYGAQVDTTGAFTFSVLQNTYSVSAVAPGYHASVPQLGGASLHFALQANGSSELPPVLSQAEFVPARQVPEDPVVFAVAVQVQDPNDYLVNPVVLINPATLWAGALNPNVNNSNADPNSLWSETLTASGNTGVFNYVAVATTAAGLTGVAQAQLTISR